MSKKQTCHHGWEIQNNCFPSEFTNELYFQGKGRCVVRFIDSQYFFHYGGYWGSSISFDQKFCNYSWVVVFRMMLSPDSGPSQEKKILGSSPSRVQHTEISSAKCQVYVHQRKPYTVLGVVWGQLSQRTNRIKGI